MQVMVTGAGGYIGRGVVKQLLDAGHDVVAISNTSCGLAHTNLVEYVEDVFSYVFEENNIPDVLLHLAWRNGFSHNEISHLEDLPKHYLFIRNALESDIKRIAIMGSMHEVGYFEGAVDELTPCNPTTPYSVAKNALRQLSCELCRQYDAEFQWLRGFYLVSSDGCGSSIFSKIFAAEQKGDALFPLNSGSSKYDFLPYDDFCRQVVAAITQDKVNGIINICSGNPVALGERIEQFIDECGFSIKPDYGKYPDRPYDSPAIWGDDSKIKKILMMGRCDE